MKKYKLIGAILCSAVFCSLSPIDAAIADQLTERRIGGNQPDFTSHGNGDSELQEMASKKPKKKAKKKKKKKSKAS